MECEVGVQDRNMPSLIVCMEVNTDEVLEPRRSRYMYTISHTSAGSQSSISASRALNEYVVLNAHLSELESHLRGYSHINGQYFCVPLNRRKS